MMNGVEGGPAQRAEGVTDDFAFEQEFSMGGADECFKWVERHGRGDCWVLEWEVAQRGIH